MKWIITILLLLLLNVSFSQTMIEMTSPEDANLILLEVKDSSQADIYVYRTDRLKEAKEWDCMWKFKKFGFSNFAIYIAKNEKELYVSTEESLNGLEYKEYIPAGKVYFVKNKEHRGYRKGFALEGVMKVTAKKKIKVRKNDLE